MEGVLWLDPATGELRDLEFEFVDLNLVGYPREYRAWGQAWFRRLPPGIWVVSRWWIRTPVIRVSIRGTTLHGYREDGGEVTRLELADGSTIDLTERGTLSGYAADGISGGALGGAAVYLVGTGYVTTTDAVGRFRFDLVPEGRYVLNFRHPDPHLDGMEGPSREVHIGGGEPTSVRLDFRSEWAVDRLCSGETPSSDGEPIHRAALLGRVREAETGDAVPEAVVWLRPRDGVEPSPIQADSTGMFLVCGLGPPGPASLQAAAEGRLSDTVWVVLPESGLVLQDVELSAASAAGAAPQIQAAVSLRGTVRSAETDEPVPGALVRLLGTEFEQVTGEGGAFAMLGVPRGQYRMITEHLGMVSDTANVDLTEGSLHLALLTLDTRPVPLPALDVEIERAFANPRIAGFYRRMERGLGDFITRENLEARDVLSNFRRLPNVQIAQCASGGVRVPDCWDIEIARGAFADALRGGRRCRPLIYIDGHLLSGQAQDASSEFPGENPFSQLQRYPRHGIEGIEVYRNPAAAPAQYRMLGDACGIVLVWTGRRS